MAKFIAHSPNGQAYQCDSLAEVKQVEGGFKFRKKRKNGGCGCGGACGNPHCGPKKRNGKRPADQYQFAAWQEKAKGMTDAQLLYVIKDAREAAKAVRGHDPVSEGWYEDEANTMAQELYRRRQGKRRNPAGQGEEFNMAAFAGAVEHGLLPPKSATPDYKKGYAEGARIAKQNKLAVAAALGSFRSSGSQAKAGELLREMAGTASTSTPIGNPRKKRNGLDPRYVPAVLNPKKRNGKISKSHLAHEKEEEQIFATMLTKLPVGVTMKAGKHRVRKLSKGFAVVDGERLTMKDAAAKLHGR